MGNIRNNKADNKVYYKADNKVYNINLKFEVYNKADNINLKFEVYECVRGGM